MPGLFPGYGLNGAFAAIEEIPAIPVGVVGIGVGAGADVDGRGVFLYAGTQEGEEQQQGENGCFFHDGQRVVIL